MVGIAVQKRNPFRNRTIAAPVMAINPGEHGLHARNAHTIRHRSDNRAASAGWLCYWAAASALTSPLP